MVENESEALKGIRWTLRPVYTLAVVYQLSMSYFYAIGYRIVNWETANDCVHAADITRLVRISLISKYIPCSKFRINRLGMHTYDIKLDGNAIHLAGRIKTSTERDG